MKNVRYTPIFAALITTGLLAACAAPGPNAKLESARSVVTQTGDNAEVVRRAPLELKAARDTIEQADKLWKDKEDAPETEHLAYLATQRAQIAKNVALSRQADDQLRDANSMSDRLRLEARTREAELARQQADTARQQAAQQARNAEVALEQAKRAQADAQRALANAKTSEERAAAERAQNLAAQQAAEAERARAAQATADAAAAQDRVKALEAQIRDIEAQQTERGLLVTLGDVLFAFNKAELTTTSGPRLDKLAGFLAQFPQRKLLIEGYTDGVGSDAYNQQLSERRAESVRDALTSRGVAPDRIQTKGYGKAYPVSSNSNPEGRAMNRRVEVIIADENGNLKGRS